MPPLNGAIPLTQMTDSAILVSCNLYFYMAWLLHKFLHIYTVIFERRCGFCFSIVVSSFHFVFFPHYPHSLSTATGCSFYNNWIAHTSGYTFCFFNTFQKPLTARNNRNAGGNHCFLCSDFITHSGNHIGSRPNKFNSVIRTYLGKLCILRQKTIPWMNSISIGNFYCSH